MAMVLAVDIGNSATKIAFFEGDSLKHVLRFPSGREMTAEGFAAIIQDGFNTFGIEQDNIEGGMISSVVPAITPVISASLEIVCGKKLLQLLAAESECGIGIDYSPPGSLGSDRIADAYGAVIKYGAPVITVDFGTASTFGAVDENSVFIGGAIAPGIKTAASALIERASNLGGFDLSDPGGAINDNTADAVRAGVLYGFAGLTDGILARMKQELPCKVIATGGLGETISPYCKEIDHVDKYLTLFGIYNLYLLNKKDGRM